MQGFGNVLENIADNGNIGELPHWKVKQKRLCGYAACTFALKKKKNWVSHSKLKDETSIKTSFNLGTEQNTKLGLRPISLAADSTAVGSLFHNVGEELVLVGFSVVDQDQGRQKLYRKLDHSVLLEELATIVFCDDTLVTHNDVSKNFLIKNPQMLKLYDFHQAHMYRVDDFARYSVDTQFFIPPFAARQIATIFVLSTSLDSSFSLGIKDDEFLGRNYVSNIRDSINKVQGVVQAFCISIFNQLKFADCHPSINFLKSLLWNLWYIYLYIYRQLSLSTSSFEVKISVIQC